MDNNKKYIQIVINSDENFSIESNLKPMEILGYLRYSEKKIWLDMINNSSTNIDKNNILKEL
jgi:hypothetical protein